MRTIEVTVHTSVRPTERTEKVVHAIENIFPELIMDILDDRIEAYDGSDSLLTFHKLLRAQMILDTARSVMLSGRVEDAVTFRLSKQAAFMGRVSFPLEEEPLGSIHVRITGSEKLVDWLAPQTKDGVPIEEIELAQGQDNV